MLNCADTAVTSPKFACPFVGDAMVTVTVVCGGDDGPPPPPPQDVRIKQASIEMGQILVRFMRPSIFFCIGERFM
jgi:hypothetical protein